MGEFLDNYGRIIISVIIILALVILGTWFANKYDGDLKAILNNLFSKAGVTG